SPARRAQREAQDGFAEPEGTPRSGRLRRRGRQDEGGGRARVLARTGQGQGPAPDGRSGHLRDPPRAGLGREPAGQPLREARAALIVVVSGPGGVGKGTIVEHLTGADDRLWLSRSWTTRPRRPGERHDAYRFVDRATCEAAANEGRFLEWAEVVPGQFSGTPRPDPPADSD